ncbi:hypothetical protein [Parasediminibacterium sp. JCM 36343]|uniref:hypothetical protein n=1 Tax=Parasediminibacterium sp. JCM 36343 TaxID=3374279 RepID=UPI00397D6E67
MKYLVYVLFLIVCIATHANAQTAKISLSDKDKANSSLFQSQKGKDRLATYKQLQSLIRVKDASADVLASTRMGAKTTTISEVVALLGEPDKRIQQTLLEYNLKNDESSKLVIGINKFGEVQFCTVKNSN